MKRERSNLQSTKETTKSVGLDDLEVKRMKENYFPSSNTPNTKTNEVAYKLLERSSQGGKAFMDLTGKYPIKSTSDKKNPPQWVVTVS